MKVRDLPCSAKGCEQNALLRSGGGPACNRHYQLWIRHGNFDGLPKTSRATSFECSHCKGRFERAYGLAKSRRARPQYCSRNCELSAKRARALAAASESFWSRVDKRADDTCWPWSGQINESGYGVCNLVGHATTLAHRIAFTFSSGRDPGDLNVCHSCDNPPCCNPNHLWLGTRAENIADMDRKGRRRAAIRRGVKSSACRLGEAQVMELLTSPETNRQAAARLGVTPSAIFNIRTGRTWSHLTGLRHA